MNLTGDAKIWKYDSFIHSWDFEFYHYKMKLKGLIMNANKKLQE